MTTTLTITSQGQIYLPKAIRKALKITATTRFNATVKDKILHLKIQDSPTLKLSGSLKKYAQKKKVDLDNIRDQIDYSDLP